MPVIMRVLAATGAFLAMIGSARSVVAQPAQPQPVLFLFAEGERSAEAERFLRELCTLVGERPELARQFDSVSVMRGIPEARGISIALDNTPTSDSVEVAQVR